MMEKGSREIVMRRLKISRLAFEEVAWDMHGEAIMKVEPRYRVNVRRLIWYEIPTGAKLTRNGYREDITCALCGEQDGERHFLKCEKLK